MSELKSQDLKDYQKEPAAAGASYTRFNQEVKKLKEENTQLIERMRDLNAKMTELESANKSLSESVEHFEEEKGRLSCQVEELTAQLQDSARCGVPLRPFDCVLFLECTFIQLYVNTVNPSPTLF